jgi:hypothetical protein
MISLAVASALKTGIPRLSKTLATIDLPEPIPPVKPIITDI